MPEYKIMRWDESTFDVEKYAAAKYAHKVKKYALVSDVCRYNVLYEYGGISSAILGEKRLYCGAREIGLDEAAEMVGRALGTNALKSR